MIRMSPPVSVVSKCRGLGKGLRIPDVCETFEAAASIGR